MVKLDNTINYPVTISKIGNVYNIKRTSNAPKKYVSNLLRFPDTKISQRLKKVHQLYEKIGSIRKSHGKKKTKITSVSSQIQVLIKANHTIFCK